MFFRIAKSHIITLNNDEKGSATVWSLMMTIMFMMIGGLTIDVSNAFRVKQLLQVTADSAALAGAWDVDILSTAETTAIAYAQFNMPVASFGTVLENANILVGTWNNNTRVFTETNINPDAIQVMTRQSVASGNPVPTFLLGLADYQRWDISATATAQIHVRECDPGSTTPGMYAGGQVQISSNNTFVNEYCIHGALGVKVSSNNTFGPGVTVTMEDLGDFQMPSSGFETNVGLQPALGETYIKPTLASEVLALAQSLLSPRSEFQPNNILANQAVVTHARSTFNSANLLPNRVNVVTCNGNQQVSITTNLNGVVLVSNGCRINFAAVTVINSLIATTNSVTGNGTQIGLNDACDQGGGSKIVAAGNISFSNASSYYGSQVVSGGNIHLSARQRGIDGSSFWAAGDIQVTSNGAFGSCNADIGVIKTRYSVRLVD